MRHLAPPRDGGAFDHLAAMRSSVAHLASLHDWVRRAGSTAVLPTIDPIAFRVVPIDERGTMHWRFAVDGRLVLDVRMERAQPGWQLDGDWMTGFGDLYEEINDVGEEARWCWLSDTLHVRSDPWRLAIEVQPCFGMVTSETDVAVACAAARAVVASPMHPDLRVDCDLDLTDSTETPSRRRWFRRRRYRHRNPS